VRVLLPLLLLVVLAFAGCGGDDANDAAAPATVTVAETVTVTETATETEPRAEPQIRCSATGALGTPLPAQDLPSAVAEVRQRIFDAALACDYEALEAIALEKGEGFTFSYGGGTDASEFWRAREEGDAVEPNPGPMRSLATILTMPFTRNEAGSYAWPTAYSENPTEEAWEALVVSGLYAQEEVDAMRTGGTGYLGYRTAITADGDWQFFVAGD
jgi:hypothetical protein